MTHHSRLGGIMIDCQTQDLKKEATFWSGALGLEIQMDETMESPRYIGLKTPQGEPYMEVQAVEHPSRVHLDIKTDDVDAEVSRLEQLGAKKVQKIKHWWIMEAPSGHRFCVVPMQPDQNVGTMNEW